MKTSILLTTAALSFIASNFPAAAEDSASVEVTAELAKDELPPSVLEITATQDLEVGKIKIPNGSEPGSQCHYVLGYELDGDSSRSVRTYYEQNEGTVLGTDSPTPSGCAWDVVDESSPLRLPGFGVSCDVGREVSALLSYSGSRPGVFFSGTSETGGFVEINKSNGDFISLSSTPNFKEACVERSNGEGGYLAIYASAKLIVSEDAEVSDGAISIGTISLDVSY